MANKKTRIIVLTGVLSGLAWILMVLELPLFVYFPSYLKIDFSDIPAILGGIIAGPLVGIAIELVKNILHFFTMSKEGGIGEIANFFAGVGLILPMVVIIRKNEKRMMAGFIAGIISMAVVANIINYFITLPLYMQNPPASVLWSTILAFLLPFNIVKGIIVCVVAFFLYMTLKKVIAKYKV
jgi:riboflavin transporter FmnP